MSVLPRVVSLQAPLLEERLDEDPLRISFTMTVPDEVPSLFHNSPPCVELDALKKIVLPSVVIHVGLLE